MLQRSSPVRILCFALIGLCLSWLTSCGAQAPQEDALEFWTMQLKPEFTEYVTGVIETFEADNPENPVRWEDVPWNAMETKILTAVSAQTAPDVVNLNPKFASQLATRNAWLDLNGAVTPDDRGAYLPKIWEAGMLGGESFGVPWYLTTQITVYNQELLAAAGIEEPPATYEELATVAQAVKEKTGKYAFFVTFVPEDSGEVLESFVKMGVTLVDESGQAAFDTPAGRAAFQYWVDLYAQDLLPPEVLTQGHRYAIDLYQAGETAVLATSAQFLGAIATNAPEVAQVSAAAPQITGETGKKNVAVMNLVIPRNSDRPEAAVQFALFVTNSDNQLAFAQAAKVLPSTQEALQKYIAFLKGKPDPTPVEIAVTVGAEQLADAEVLIPPMEKLNLLQKAIYENLQGAMLGQKTVEAAVQDAAAQFNAG
ncbi:ABC transporter substrate-binding protein [Spirulina major]|uniref:ABC transporter substrate-binding protein n=1 Tax=Spirulina major TaxID=270636 RepID=UPI0009326E7D|nr:sugar ABC transporter substrate-binding protein [Spirulina major]